MERYVLDHELLQQATSAEYSEGDSGGRRPARRLTHRGRERPGRLVSCDSARWP